jgi:hypothetical protein
MKLVEMCMFDDRFNIILLISWIFTLSTVGLWETSSFIIYNHTHVKSSIYNLVKVVNDLMNGSILNNHEVAAGFVRTVVSVSAPIRFIRHFYQRSQRGDKNGQSTDMGNIVQYWIQDADRR